jgi:adenosylcobyric acid synthase
MARAIMFQGTGSDVGKSLIVAGLARAYARRGHRVRPFKPQNMSNNAGVAADGGEIGRAQLVQARAAGVEPSVHMNPVLLKPEAETGAQVVVRGRVAGRASARDYQAMKAGLLPRVLESFERLAAEADLVLVEGAGSPAEINLRPGDIANMGFARAAGLPVALIGDIERGGVIAQIVGTCAVLAPADRKHLAGFVVNRFRGDPALFDAGMTAIARRTGLAPLGLLPWFAEAWKLPAEDALGLDSGFAASPPTPPHAARGIPSRARVGWGESTRAALESQTRLKIAVPRLPRIANFDDLDPLRLEPAVELVMVPPGRPLPGDAALVILPGSKATMADLACLRAEGWDIDVAAHLRRGGWLLGLCAGFQMLGRRLDDPKGLEGPAGAVDGLGLIEVDTVLEPEKRLARVEGRELLTGAPVAGYEMHMGRSQGPGLARPMLTLGGRPDGAVAADGRVMGCYLHGLFAGDRFRAAFLERLGAASSGLAYEHEVDAVLDRLACHLEAHLDLDTIWALAAQRFKTAKTNISTRKRPPACR